MENKVIFARNLKNLMDANQISRRDLSEALNISYHTITDWVKGKKYPRMDKVEILANYFGVLKSDLIEDKSVADQVEADPVGIATQFATMLKDPDFMELYEEYKKLNAEGKKIIKKFIRSMTDENV